MTSPGLPANEIPLSAGAPVGQPVAIPTDHRSRLTGESCLVGFGCHGQIDQEVKSMDDGTRPSIEQIREWFADESTAGFDPTEIYHVTTFHTHRTRADGRSGHRKRLTASPGTRAMEACGR